MKAMTNEKAVGPVDHSLELLKLGLQQDRTVLLEFQLFEYIDYTMPGDNHYSLILHGSWYALYFLVGSYHITGYGPSL